MKVKVNRPFFDKYTKQRYITDQILDVEDSRGEELLADERKLVDLVEEAKKESKAETKAEAKAEAKEAKEKKPKKATKKG